MVGRSLGTCASRTSASRGVPGLAIRASYTGPRCIPGKGHAPIVRTRPGVAEGSDANVTGTAMRYVACTPGCLPVGSTKGTGSVVRAGRCFRAAHEALPPRVGVASVRHAVALVPPVRGAVASRAPDVPPPEGVVLA